MERRKNAEVDIDKQRGLFFSIGFVVALSLLLLAFEWRSFKDIIVETFNITVNNGPVEEIAAIIIPNSAPLPPPPPPDVVEIMEIVENDKVIENEMEVQSVEAPDAIQVATSSGVSTDTGPEEVVDDQVFMIVEEMPRFAGCESIKDEDKATECFQREIGKFLSKNIQYPQRAKEANVEGIVYVSFTVDGSGKVKDVKTLRGIGFGCDEEAVRVVSKLPQFTPGKQRGRAVSVGYNLPINFKLK
jgi:protein TonB